MAMGEERDGSVKTASPGAVQEHCIWLDVNPNHTVEAWRRSRGMIRIWCLVRNPVGLKVMSERPEASLQRRDRQEGVKFGSMGWNEKERIKDLDRSAAQVRVCNEASTNML